MNIKRLIQKKFFEDYCFNNQFSFLHEVKRNKIGTCIKRITQKTVHFL